MTLVKSFFSVHTGGFRFKIGISKSSCLMVYNFKNNFNYLLSGQAKAFCVNTNDTLKHQLISKTFVLKTSTNMNLVKAGNPVNFQSYLLYHFWFLHWICPEFTRSIKQLVWKIGKTLRWRIQRVPPHKAGAFNQENESDTPLFGMPTNGRLLLLPWSMPLVLLFATWPVG